MNTSSQESVPLVVTEKTSEGICPASNYLALRATCWAVALVLGAAEAWATRFTMNPDGISYMDIGDAYWRSDWHNAINAYWSPLYSVMLGFFLRVVKPSMYWEFPLVHAVNFLIYVATLCCFEFFLDEFIRQQSKERGRLCTFGLAGLPVSAWWLLGYALFLSCLGSPIMIGCGLVSPDMSVAAFVFLASGLVLRICAGRSSAFAALGVVLGFGYLAKSIMFPLAFAFLVVLLLGKPHRWRRVLVSALVFLVVACPFVIAISREKGHVTIGESARWNYLVFIDNVRPFFPQAGPPIERPRRLVVWPRVHDLSNTLAGTYPPWIDPSYWQSGIKSTFSLRNQLRVIGHSLRAYWRIFSDTLLELGFVIAFAILTAFFRVRWRGARLGFEWRMLVPSMCALSAYTLLLVENRYVAPFTMLLWLSLFSLLAFDPDVRTSKLVRFTIGSSCAAATIAPIALTLMALHLHDVPRYFLAASSLQASGVRPGSRVAVIWDDDWESGAGEGSFIVRLLRAHTVGEAEPASVFWSQTEENQSKVIAALFQTGAKAIIARKPPTDSGVAPCWRRLGGSGFFACFPAATVMPAGSAVP